ncbi:MAG TPA: hypothetical protein VIG51_00515 [Candidatus Baltobacteraceae bacterium]|jgi:hypothetical protein
MHHGYRAALALTSLILLGSPAWACDKRTARANAGPQPHYAAADLYSKRALRRARIILQLKLLELREARLERVREALERNAPIDELFTPEPHPAASPSPQCFDRLSMTGRASADSQPPSP